MTDGDITIRRCVADDAAALRAIRLEALADSPEAYGSTFEEASAFTDARWRALCERSLYFLAWRGERVVGMSSGGSHDGRPGTRWLYGLYVTPDARGTGAAQQLVDAVEQWARTEGVTSLYLHVTETVARARGFYAKNGFRATGEGIVMSRDPSLRLITMVKSIAP